MRSNFAYLFLGMMFRSPSRRKRYNDSIINKNPARPA